MSYQTTVLPVKPAIPAWDDSRRGWLGLASFEGFGCRTLQKLSTTFGADGVRAWHVSETVLTSYGCSKKTIAAFNGFRTTAKLDALEHELTQEGILFVHSMDDLYPPLLRQIADPPLALFVRGSLEPAHAKCLAVVGTRRNTSYGKHIAEWMCSEIAPAGITILSGLAGGIDTIAHEATLDAGGSCIAVLGSGNDDATIYPRCNERLAKRIIDSGGAVVSEFPPKTPGLRHHFPLRNRIISGMSNATLIVEGTEKSGSLITAHFALEQNRDVFAVPGPITSMQSHGTNRLLAMGAIPCLLPSDILLNLNADTRRVPRACVSSLTADEQRIIKLLSSPQHVDDIARACALPIHQVNALLSRLEMQGFIALQGPNMFGCTR